MIAFDEMVHLLDFLRANSLQDVVSVVGDNKFGSRLPPNAIPQGLVLCKRLLKCK